MPMKNHWARLGCDQVEAAGMMVMGWKPCQDWINWACCCCRCRRRRRGCRWLAVAVTVAVGLLEPPPLSSIICSFKPPCLMRISSSKVPQLILTFSLLSGSRWCLGLWPAWTEDQQVLKWRMAVSSQSWFGLIWDHKLQPRCFHWGGLNLPIRHLGQKKQVEAPSRTTWMSHYLNSEGTSPWKSLATVREEEEVLSLYKWGSSAETYGSTAEILYWFQMGMEWYGRDGPGVGRVLVQIQSIFKALGTIDVALF